MTISAPCPAIPITAVCARWESAERPLFKGRLIDEDGCCCAQGDILRMAGTTDGELREMAQSEADRKVADALGISRTHAVLLRNINDSRPDSPEDVLTAPENILGPHAGLILSFWKHLDGMNDAAWAVVWAAEGAGEGAAEGAAARDAARAMEGAAAARDAVLPAAWNAPWAAALIVSWAAVRATWEIQGHERLPSLYFLPLFGLTIDALKAMAGSDSGPDRSSTLDTEAR